MALSRLSILGYLVVLMLLCCTGAAGASCTRYWVGGGSANTWAATGNTNWATSSGGANNAAVPTSTDVVCFDSNSGSGNSVIGATITVAALNCDGTDTGASGSYGGTLTQNSGIVFIILGPLTLSSGMTYSPALNSTEIAVEGSVGGNINTYGKTMGYLAVAGTGSWTLVGSFTGGYLGVSEGTLATGGYAINLSKELILTGSSTRTLNLGSSVVTIAGTGVFLDATNISGLTLTASASTVIISDVSSSSKVFTGNTLTWGALTITGGGTGGVTFSGANTFSTFTIGNPKTVTFPASVTTTIGTFVAVGAAGSLITIVSSSAGTQATLSQASGTVCSDYLSLKDSNATGGASWYDGAHSTIVSNVTGWINSACPTSGRTCTVSVLGAGTC